MKGASKGEVMFDSELDRETSSTNVRRRAFLGFSLSAAAGLALWSFRKTRIAEAAMPAEAGGDVTVIRFSDDGQRLEKLRIPKVVRSEDDWRKQLSPGEIRNLPSRENVGTCTTRVCIVASAVTMRCSVQKRNLNQERGGQVFGSQSHPRTCVRFETAHLEW
jgi:hypothetical protein